MKPEPLCQLCVQRVLDEVENPTALTEDIVVRRGVYWQRWVVPYEDEDGVTGADEVRVPVCAQHIHLRSQFLRDCVQQEMEMVPRECDGPRARREGQLVC